MTHAASNSGQDAITRDFQKWWLSLPEDLKRMYASDGITASESAFRAGRNTIWNPIETAPKGTLAIFYDANATEVRTCIFVDRISSRRFCLDPKRSATHWMALSAPITHAPTSSR